jgi:hypothetical protein
VRVLLYLDEDSARHSLARELRLRGAEVATALEVGMVGRSDDDQLEWATNCNRALYSFNRRDFYRIHTDWLRATRSHSGIILSKQELSVGEQMRRLLRLIARLSAEEMRNRVEFLTNW